MKTIICNDFSLFMLSEDSCNININKISLKEFYKILDSNNYISCVGDENIANLFNLKCNKCNISLDKSTRLIVIKIVGNIDDFPNIDCFDIKYGECC